MSIKCFSLILCVTLAFACMSVPAHASTIGLCDDTGDTTAATNGTCSKVVSYSSGNNRLTIALTNTTSSVYGGFLTADAFLLPDTITGVSLFSTTNAAFQLSANPTVNPFDNQGHVFNWLLSATNNDWEGGGAPDDGIVPGSSATFILQLTGTIGSLTKQQFESGIVTSEATRFRGFIAGGSDKDLVGEQFNEVSTVPEPGSMLLLGMGLSALKARRYLRRS